MTQSVTVNSLPFGARPQEDTEAWERFGPTYQRYQALVRQVLYNVAGAQELDDLVQEAWIKVWRGWQTFENRSNLKTWLYRIAVNTALDYHRRRKAPLPIDSVEDTQDPSSTDSPVITQELIQQGLERLSPEHRTVVTLALFEQRPLQEVADIMGSELGTTKSRLHYARHYLRNFLEKQGVRP